MHKSARQLSRLADHLEYPDVLVRSCGAIKILQFPFAAEAGIVVSVDCEDELPCGFVADCTPIIDDRQT